MNVGFTAESKSEFIGFLNLSFGRSSDAVLLIDGHACVQFANSAASNILQLDETYPTGKSLFDSNLLAEDFAWAEYIDVCKESALAGKNCVLTLAESHAESMQYSSQYMLLGDQPYILLVSINQKQANELRNTTQRLNKLETTANIGTWEVDLITNELLWSDQTRRIHEVANDYIPDVATSIAFYKEGFDRTRITEVYQRAVQQLVPWDEKLTIVTANGNERLMRVIGNAESVDGVCTRVFGVFQDITHQETIKRELIESERMLQDIMDRSPAVVYVKGLDGRYKFINQKYLSIFGFKRKQVLGKDDFELLPANVALEVTNNDKAVIASKTNKTLEETILQKDGKRIYISEKFPLFDEKGNVTYLCGISTDITQQRENEVRLRQVQKMDALGKLSGGIAHDINNLLSIISGHSELIAMNEQSLHATTIRSNLQIAKACERGAHLTKRLLGFSRNQSAKLEVCNLNELIRQNYELLRRLLTTSVDFQIETDKDLWDCEIDKFDFEDALLNLILNAQQAIPETGNIKIITNNIVIQTEYDDAELTPGEYVQITVVDNGCGMDELTKQRIFEPFYTTKGTDGSGLGMSQVYGFLQRCNGHIKVESSPGKGASVQLFLPRAHRLSFDTSNTDERVDTRYEVTAKSKTIVVVDDEPELTHVIDAVLSANGYSVILFHHGAEALAYIEQHHVDMIITDIVMPNMTGVELARQTRQSRPDIQVLYISGYPDRHAPQKESDMEASILSKPFKAAQLLQQVNAQLSDN